MLHDIIELISRKRHGHVLDDEEIRWLIVNYIEGDVSDEQMASLAMAVAICGLSFRELSTWTLSMAATGQKLDWQELDSPTVDKHSTGGVGDKITLVLTPLIASCGGYVPQVAGRGLGYAGGTLDKLESIPGFQVLLSPEKMLSILQTTRAVICGAGPDLALADQKLYALRDVTGTVDSIPLIASSIMSKKIAAGVDSLVLDVKVGSGAYMKDRESAAMLAKTMIALGKAAGMNVMAYLTAMDTPLGLKIGNSLEVEEALEVLAGGGPPDVVELTLALADEMLALGEVRSSKDPREALRDGSAMDAWRRVVSAQGGDPDAGLPRSSDTHTIAAEKSGVLSRLDAAAVGVAAWRLGAGRGRPRDPITHASGVTLHAKPGDLVLEGQPLVTLHTNDPSRFGRAIAAINEGYDISHEAQPRQSVIIDKLF